MPHNNLARELEVACQLARQAGAVAMHHLRSGLQVEHKGGDPTNPVTQADKEANALIVAGLAAAFPEDAILAEEATPQASRHAARRLWCVDPIDGTRDYIAGTGQFVVMIGLAIDGAAKLGVVYAPTLDKLWHGANNVAVVEAPDGNQTLRVSTCAQSHNATLVASRSHVSTAVTRLAQTLRVRDKIGLGSVGLKMAWVAQGSADMYFSLSNKTHEWDACAPEAILVAAGGRVTDTCGEPLLYNKPQTQTPHGIVASNGLLHDACLAALRPLIAERGWAPQTP